jgi:GAF domain-containing protein
VTDMTRDAKLMSTFAALADTLVDDYDVVELLQTLVDACRDLLGSTAAGILLSDESGDLELIASTSEATRVVEVMKLAAQDGPCIECFRTGAAISVPSIARAPENWRAFRDSALSQGFASTEAIPLRLRDSSIGTLNLFGAEEGAPPTSDLIAARAFADVATIGILHERTLRRSELLASQLQGALRSRVVIEQAKGVVAFTRGVPIDEAFDVIRSYARDHRLPLSQVAAMLVRQELDLGRA